MLEIKKTFFLILFLSIGSALFAQFGPIGTPFVKNYTRSDYQGGSQTWDIQQAANGMMYFANNKGLLEFDGVNWNIYALPNASVLRSIKVAPGGLIYAGGFNELGFYRIGDMGGAVYESLTHLVPEEYLDFDEVWNIFIHADGVIFQTFSQIMLFKNDSIQVIEAPSLFHFSFLVNNEFYVNDMDQGLMRYAMGSLYPLKGVEHIKGKEIWGILPIENKLLIATSNDGTYIYDGNSLVARQTESTEFLRKAQIYNMINLGSEKVAFGTIQDGLLICDLLGNPLQHINIDDGIQNNTILSMGLDKFGNLWLGSDYGIDFIQINSPLLQLSNNYGLSTGYAAKIYGGRLYLGTNQGLFTEVFDPISSSSLGNKDMTLIEETKGQVWTLNEIDGSLFCGHNGGTFIIKGETATKISSRPGGWIYLQVPNDKSKVIGGAYNGLNLYEKKNGKWRFSKQIKGFSESARSMEYDSDGALWITHGYKGIYKILFNGTYDSIMEIKFYDSKQSNLNAQVFGLANIDNEIFFASSSGLLNYSSELDKFARSERFNNAFKERYIRSIKVDYDDNIWYFTEEETGVLRAGEDGNYMDISLPFRELKNEFVKTFEMVYPYDDENVLFGTESGFVHYNPSFSKTYNYPFSTFLNYMRTLNPDTLFKLNNTLSTHEIVLDYSNNNIEFSYSANDFEHSGNLLYATYLEGYDKDWSLWQTRSNKEYTNLDEGKYTFKVKAQNVNGTITEERDIQFKIRPPFHRSVMAYGIYFILLLLMFYLFILAIKRRFLKAKKRNEKQQEELFRKKEERLLRESLEAEKEIIRMRNDKLREGMKSKDKELANSTIQMLHKNEMLITLRDELKKLADLSKDENHKHEVKYLVRKINKEIDNEKQWQIFEIHFESVHEEFLKRIKAVYPNLTPRELKLCAYLRMNISSKEISVLMNISTRGVEISRYRLRKKLEIERETNLTDFILSF